MSKNKRSSKKAEVLKEDKKPPIIENPKPEIKVEEITPEQEKALYEGQEHIEEPPEELPQQEKEITEGPPPDQNQLVNKPREAYLKEKINKMNSNQKLISRINQDLNDQIKSVTDDDNVLITEVPKNINRFIRKKEVNYSTDFNSKKNVKEINVLKSEQNILKNNLKQLEQNEKLLNDEGFININ